MIVKLNINNSTIIEISLILILFKFSKIIFDILISNNVATVIEIKIVRIAIVIFI